MNGIGNMIVKTAALLAMAVSTVDRADAETLEVPCSRFAAIQSAIEAARDGDTVIVSPGTYRENIDFLGKPITVQSENPHDSYTVDATIIEAPSGGPAVTFSTGEDRDSLLTGFTIAGADALSASSAGGIYCLDSSPTVTHCTIINHGPHAAIHCVGGTPTFTSCTIELGRSDGCQNVVHCVDSDASFRRCTIRENRPGESADRTYQLDGTPVVGADTTIEYDPNMTDGAVYVVEGGRMIETYLAGSRTVGGVRNRNKPARPATHGKGQTGGPAIAMNSRASSGACVRAYDILMGETLYAECNKPVEEMFREGVDIMSRYINFSEDGSVSWPYTSELDGGPLAPGRLGFWGLPIAPPLGTDTTLVTPQQWSTGVRIAPGGPPVGE